MRDRGVDEAFGALGPQAEHADVATRIGDLARLHRAGWKDGRLNLDGAVGEGLDAYVAYYVVDHAMAPVDEPAFTTYERMLEAVDTAAAVAELRQVHRRLAVANADADAVLVTRDEEVGPARRVGAQPIARALVPRDLLLVLVGEAALRASA